MAREMKDSGIEWIGEIPKNWELKRLKSLLVERKEMNKPQKTKNILSLSLHHGVTPYGEKKASGNKSKEDLTKYKLAYPGDIVLNSMNVIVGSVGLSKYFGAVSPVYYMLYARNKDSYIYYFDKLFQTNEFQKSLMGYGNGILMKESGTGQFNTIRMRIQMIKLNTVMLPAPCIEEQKLIATYLEKKCTQIDSIIEKSKEAIEEYKKYKQSLITETVTKGLDKNVPMKHSGVEWIEKVPKNWNILIGKRFLELCKKEINKNDDIITCFRDGEVTLRKNRRTDGFTVALKEIGYQGVDIGDLVVHGMDGFAGAIGISDSRGKASPVLNVMDTKQVKKYLMYYLRSAAFCDVFTGLATGIRIRSCDLRWSKIANFEFPLPPIKEQQQIANYLDNKCAEIEDIISQKEQLINELEAYKKSLIYECVTGKREVV